MNGQKNNGKGIFYGVIGVATLIVAIIGATFAYFTAQQTNTTAISGNAATISFGLSVDKVTDAGDATGIIPMTDGMAIAATSASTPCIDDNGNAVCQIYEIVVNNTGSGAIYLDGYVNLTGGLPVAESEETTTMRWAQAFAGSSTDTYSTTGSIALNSISDDATPTLTLYDSNNSQGGTTLVSSQTTGEYKVGSTPYVYIKNNYMRLSGHTGETYTRTETNCSLVYNQYLAKGASITYYIVVWLHETNSNQTPGESQDQGFFSGTVHFISAEGGEVSATFSGYTSLVGQDTPTS